MEESCLIVTGDPRVEVLVRDATKVIDKVVVDAAEDAVVEAVEVAEDVEEEEVEIRKRRLLLRL